MNDEWNISCFILTLFLSSPNRMIPPTSKNFLVNNLAAGTQYDLCVLSHLRRRHNLPDGYAGGGLRAVHHRIRISALPLHAVPVLGRHYDNHHRGHNRRLRPHFHHHPHDPLQGVQQRRLRQGDLGHRCALANQRGAIPGLYCHAIRIQTRCFELGGGRGVQKELRRASSSASRFSSPHLRDLHPRLLHLHFPGKPKLDDSRLFRVTKAKAQTSAKARPGGLRRAQSRGAAQRRDAKHQPQQLHRSSAAGPNPSAPPSRFKDTPILRRARPSSSKYMTLPVEGARAKRRYSLNENLSKHHCYIGSQKLGNVFCKRSMSVNGMLVQMANTNLDSEKTAFSSSEWILESTVWMYDCWRLDGVPASHCVRAFVCVCVGGSVIGAHSIYSKCVWSYECARFAPFLLFPSANHIFCCLFINVFWKPMD